MIYNITACQRQVPSNTSISGICTDCGHNTYLHPGISNPGLLVCVGCSVMGSYEFWDERPIIKDDKREWIDCMEFSSILRKRREEFEEKKARHLAEVQKRKELKNE